jgi:hypothetical protein
VTGPERRRTSWPDVGLLAVAAAFIICLVLALGWVFR